MQKILKGKRFAEIGRNDRNLFVTLLHLKKIQVDYRCNFDESIQLLARLNSKYSEEIDCAAALIDVLENGDEDNDDDE